MSKIALSLVAKWSQRRRSHRANGCSAQSRVQIEQLEDRLVPSGSSLQQIMHPTYVIIRPGSG